MVKNQQNEDLKILLKKYMGVVKDCNGITFIDGGPMHGNDVFTDIEKQTLRELESSLP